MTGIVPLLSLYFFAILSGWLLVSHLGLRSLLGRVLMIFTVGAAQLVFSIQVLSLFHQLTGGWLLTSNSLVTLLMGYVFWWRRRQQNSLFRSGLAEHTAAAWSSVRKHPLASAVLLMAVSIVIWFIVLGHLMFPMIDTYHFAMPLFWKQHASILPYPANDPRLVAVVFASEALAFPGQLYAQTNAMFLVFSGIAVLLTIWIVIGIARHLGASVLASVCSGTMLIGYGSFVISVIGGSSDLLLATMWFGASIFLLFESRTTDGYQLRVLACSVFCLLMACGAKNVVLIHFPWYLLAAILLFRRQLFRPKTVAVLFLAAALGLLSSGVLWSYVSNVIWFGNPKGHPVLSETVDVSMKPAAVWTRLLRGGVGSFLDPIWLPQRFQEPYKTAFRKTIEVFGGKRELPEDQRQYSLPDESLRPGRGLGLLGLAVLAPSVLIGAIYSFRRFNGRERRNERTAMVLALVVLTVGSFITFYIVLRTQKIGISRLMISALVVGAPLAALPLEKRAFRVFSLAVFLVCVPAYSVYSLGMVARRRGPEALPQFAQKITRMQMDRSMSLDYEWAGEPPGVLQIREDYSAREFVQFALSRIPGPAVIGLIGGDNVEEYFAFGKNFSNKVVALLDARTPERLLDAPSDVEYILVRILDVHQQVSERYPDFDLWLKMQSNGKTVLTLFKRHKLENSDGAKFSAD